MADNKKQQQKKKQDANPYGSKFTPKKKDPLKPFLPVIGLMVMAAAGAVAWFGSPFLITWLFNQTLFTIPGNVRSADPFYFQLLVSIMIFFVIVGIFGLLYAIVAPRPPKTVHESVLMNERKQAELDRQRDIARKRKMKSRMKDANKDIMDI
jgi:hypothetical protein